MGCALEDAALDTADVSSTAAPIQGAGAGGFVPMYTALVLQNGWTNAPFATRAAEVGLDSDIVMFRGAIAGGSSAVVFTLPVGFRPATNVYVPVDLCNATKGRLVIQPSGVVSVQAAGGTFASAQCFTSLEGASFALMTNGFTTLALQNGWTHAPFGTRRAAVTNDNGIIRLAGAIASGTSAAAFTLPVGFRPPEYIYLPIDLCNAKHGHLLIQPDGDAFVGPLSDAQCFASLEGASFALSSASFTTLWLNDGWQSISYAAPRPAAVTNDGRIIRFAGAIQGGTSSSLFTLPIGFRPPTTVYVPVELISAKGRLVIQPSGAVTVQDSGGGFASAHDYTSLEGAWFAL